MISVSHPLEPAMGYILALDQGTTSSRAIVFDAEGRIHALAQEEFPQHYPRPGWVEHDPEDIWRSQLAVARRALAALGSEVAAVRALGIANQRETTVLWERAGGRALAPAIVWQDRRTAARCAALHAAGRAEAIRERTGLVVDAYFSATKLEWLLDHIPGARVRAEAGELAWGTVDSWLVYRLSGGRAHVTDPSNASRSLLYDIHKLAWDEGLLAEFRVPAALLPSVVPSSGECASVDAALLGCALPIAGIAGDQQAAAFGQACLSPGMAKNTYGTGCFLMVNTGARPVDSRNRLLATVGWQIGDRVDYFLEGSVFMAGAVVQWLRDGLGIIASAAEIEALAASVADNGGVSLVPAFTGLGAPHWDASARGTILGLTRGSTRAHIARAALESIALQSADVLEAARRDAGVPLAELRVDGGAARNDLLMQFQADVLGVPVLRPRVTETTALGAATLAGLAVGMWSGPEDIAQHWQVERIFEPAMAAGEREAVLARWRQAVERARGWAEDGV
jgi:glycerol kinase